MWEYLIRWTTGKTAKQNITLHYRLEIILGLFENNGRLSIGELDEKILQRQKTKQTTNEIYFTLQRKRILNIETVQQKNYCLIRDFSSYTDEQKNKIIKVCTNFLSNPIAHLDFTKETWSNDPITFAQKDYLKNLGVDQRTINSLGTKGEASQKINEVRRGLGFPVKRELTEEEALKQWKVQQGIGYSKDELKDAIILGLNEPGQTISELRGKDRNEWWLPDDKEQEKYSDIPVWHNKPEIDEFVAKKINIPQEKLAPFPSRGTDGVPIFYQEVAGVLSQLRADGEIIDWHKDGGVWRLKYSKMIEEKFPGPKEPNGMEKEPNGMEKEPSYWLLRHNEDSPWKDDLGKKYHFGSAVPNQIPLRESGVGTRTIWFTKIDGSYYFWGHGTVSKITQLAELEKNIHDHVPEDGDSGPILSEKQWELVYDKFTFFDETENSENIQGKFLKKGSRDIKQKITSVPNFNKQTSMFPISKEIYETILNEKNLEKEEPKLETFEDKQLERLDKNRIKHSLEEIRDELLIPDEKILEVVDALSAGRHVLLAGPIGTGKTRLAKLIPEIFWSHDGGYLADDYTATSDWNTQDVIGGIFPKMEDGDAKYDIQYGCLVETVHKNWENGVNGGMRIRAQELNGMDELDQAIRGNNSINHYRGVWLIIDEFNRADIDKAFGQLFTALRTRKLKIPTSEVGKSYKKLDIPKDFRIIGTLNTQDKHFLHQLSDALKSRFAYIEIDIPTFEQKDTEMYYAALHAINDLELDDKTSRIMFNHKNKKLEKILEADSPRLQEMSTALEKAYRVLHWIRGFNKLGTAILKLIFQQIIVGSIRSNSKMDDVVENALITNLIPQLEKLKPQMIETIEALCANDIIGHIIKSHESQDRESYFKSMEILEDLLVDIDEMLMFVDNFKDGKGIKELEDSHPDHTLNQPDPKLPRFIKELEKLRESMVS